MSGGVYFTGRRRLPPGTLVTVVAWIFIATSGIGTLAAIAEGTTYLNVSRHIDFDEVPDHIVERMSWLQAFMLRNVRELLTLRVLLSGMTLAAAIGLLQRFEWARLLFVSMMVLTAGWSLLAPWIGTVGSLQRDIDGVGSSPALAIAHFFAIVIGAVVAAACGWVAWRLNGPDVVAEFRRSASRRTGR